ncbi:MAG: BlaI/MecI/CopY family transcriptional regulator [Firmicutes bacterium]|nr:BlaI/MecI/CopY family transcriptional regulator [Bacillota bacterium]MDY3771203.1 BlaI/MecI/CopY family transcriptional regulator [Lachnospiraceae bacterium]
MPKKQPFQKITNRELEIMQLLWHADHPLIASEIAAMKPDLTVNTVQSVLRNLLKHKYIEVAKIVYSGTVLTRSYRPLITEQEFGVNQVIRDFHSFQGLSVSHLVAGLLNEPVSASEIDELESIIQKQRALLKENPSE